MKTKIIICEEWLEEKFPVSITVKNSKISPRPSGLVVRKKFFRAKQKIVLQKTLFRLTASPISFTQHELFLQMPGFDFKKLNGMQK